jgi:two-component system alkaline phosphatase synthesis response regulator PhoP
MQKQAYIVEDDENIREIIRCALESCGLRVTGFEDAVEMFGALSKQLPDIILLDLMLPRMDGLDALKQLKADARSSHIPVLILTAKSSETDKVAGLDLGADDYITKPFGVLELMARVRAALRRASGTAEAPSACEARGLRLDSARREVTLNGIKIELTLKEFDLLRLLMGNADRVLTRNEILDEVWGYGYSGETRTLDMHIRSLRQKLHDDAGGGGFITTVRGVGYKFNA